MKKKTKLKGAAQVRLVPLLGTSQPLPAPSWATTVSDFETETAFIHSMEAYENAMKASVRHRLPPYRQSLRRDDADYLLDRTNYQVAQPQMSSILKKWLKRSKTSEQRRVKGFAEKVAIVASSTWSDRMAYVRCCPFCSPRRSLYPCDETHLCPICHNKIIGDPLQQKFGGSFGKAPFWSAFSFCFVFQADKARLRLVTRMDSKGKVLKAETLFLFKSSPDVRRLTQFDGRELEACGRVPFKVLERVLKRLRKRRLIGGAVAGLDLFVEFFPVGPATGFEQIAHGFQVHVHALVNTPKPISWEDAQRIYRSFCTLREKAGISLYPDLDIRPIQTQERYKGWLRYTLKPMKFEEFYSKGAFACSDRPIPFNDEFDQTVFEGAHNAYGNVKSPRYYDNMQQRLSGKQDFIGVWQYAPKLNQSDFRRIKDRVERNLPVTGEEQEKFDDHLLYVQQQDEQRRARKAQKLARRRRGGRKVDPSQPGSAEPARNNQDAAARFWEREGEV